MAVLTGSYRYYAPLASIEYVVFFIDFYGFITFSILNSHNFLCKFCILTTLLIMFAEFVTLLCLFSSTFLSSSPPNVWRRQNFRHQSHERKIVSLQFSRLLGDITHIRVILLLLFTVAIASQPLFFAVNPCLYMPIQT